MSSFCDTVNVVVVVCFCLLWSCLVPMVMGFSASVMCVSWGGASVGGCSACLPVPNSSSTTSHSHRSRGEESIYTSPAHSEPVVNSPRRSESLRQSRTQTNHFLSYLSLQSLIHTISFEKCKKTFVVKTPFDVGYSSARS